MKYNIQLDLKSPISSKDGEIKSIKIRKMNKKDVFKIADRGYSGDGDAVVGFIKTCAIGVSDKAEIPLDEDLIKSMSMSDGIQVQLILDQMVGQKSESIISGDAIDDPIIYTLAEPIKFGSATIKQLQFKARTFGDFIAIEDMDNPEDSFDHFVRTFSTIVGHELPVTDAIINSLDCRDVFSIKDGVMGKLVDASPRWKSI